RIPVTQNLPYSADLLNHSRKYFPLIGWIVGGAGGVVLLIFAYFLPTNIAVLLSMIFTVWLTGAFHEDGFTDMCDAFGGGWGKEQIMHIMKDSRIGAYGTIGIILLLGLKFLALEAIAAQGLWITFFVLIAGHTSSRYMASLLMQSYDYVQDIDKSKVKPMASNKLPFLSMILGLIFVLIPFLFLPSLFFALALLPAYASQLYLGFYFKKHIGGYTGDCLGATQQLTEAVFYVSILAFV
ncbi:MAG: adenosylcobinamide-GDP ribazoletransferase, partial [Bernardetiaceae bacterium]|nr:adenosylcobinamide-GDP ribazoletransferase [Bernardetiaceae bacterium]